MGLSAKPTAAVDDAEEGEGHPRPCSHEERAPAGGVHHQGCVGSVCGGREKECHLEFSDLAVAHLLLELLYPLGVAANGGQARPGAFELIEHAFHFPTVR